MPELLIESGDSSNRAFTFEDDIVIGRGSTPDFAILDPTISRRHASVERRGAIYFVSDLGSGNGTRVNDVRIEAPTPLSDGDRIQLGDVQIRFKWPEAADAVEGTVVSFRAPGQTSEVQPVLDALEVDRGGTAVLTGVEGVDALDLEDPLDLL